MKIDLMRVGVSNRFDLCISTQQYQQHRRRRRRRGSSCIIHRASTALLPIKHAAEREIANVVPVVIARLELVRHRPLLLLLLTTRAVAGNKINVVKIE